MELKNKKSAWAALATIGVTAVAAGTTAIVKMRQEREKRRKLEEQKREKEKEVASLKLTPEQMMVYNEGVRKFITLNNRIFGLYLFAVRFICPLCIILIFLNQFGLLDFILYGSK